MFNREPVVKAGALASAVSVLVIWMRTMGWLDWSDTQQSAFMEVVITWLPLIIVGASPIVTSLYARMRVTPSSSPRDMDGTPLVRADNKPILMQE